jgi:hypothetical protein
VYLKARELTDGKKKEREEVVGFSFGLKLFLAKENLSETFS